ncbi:hypothetical protein JDW21_11060 [Bacillus subtilis]|uniref:hypothetical protein n=1 Tax=Bacillus subtilis TaxID=1423 RepID=UPI0008401299|nr:hypothetical protein [Bacillus subtilis]QMV48847.1 hypothetical protein Goe11_c00940 [Bacillus phage vB_BsuS-Goe11]UIS26539.1 hypothetical protein Goe14_00950 [Bacillus phage vB_BsuS-Goe14]MBG8573984.1 hypothetical protein [Bacillus subtilis]MBG9625896.1 hypothetical protein [Bacillus subtilis]MCX4077969.1 hypothetical protein [Bacillus subtilis]
MTINLKVKQEKRKGVSINDIQDGFFILKDDHVRIVKMDVTNRNKIHLIDLKTFDVKTVASIEEIKYVYEDWRQIKILSPKQVNLNIGFQWRE